MIFVTLYSQKGWYILTFSHSIKTTLAHTMILGADITNLLIITTLDSCTTLSTLQFPFSKINNKHKPKSHSFQKLQKY